MNGRTYTALIIDDDATTRSAIKLMLVKLKFRVDEAADGIEGLHQIKKRNYDLVFLDIKMPKMNGEQVIKVLRKRSESCNILLISGYLTREHVVRFAQLGVKGFLTKPIDIDKFYAEVNKICPTNMKN